MPPVQVPFDQAIRDLGSAEAASRLRAVQLLKDAAYPEAAVPLSKLVVDPHDEVQFAAIAAVINIFLAERMVSSKRVGFLVEVRAPVALGLNAEHPEHAEKTLALRVG
jgi:hypothetical protein